MNLTRVWQYLKRPLHLPNRHHLLDGGQHFAHMTYSALVFIEGHSMYAYAAGVVFVLAVVSMFVKE